MEIEYNKRKPTICKIPFSGVTINPDGNMVPCCGSAHVKLGHISKEKSLTDFINGESQGIAFENVKKQLYRFIVIVYNNDNLKLLP